MCVVGFHIYKIDKAYIFRQKFYRTRVISIINHYYSQFNFIAVAENQTLEKITHNKYEILTVISDLSESIYKKNVAFSLDLCTYIHIYIYIHTDTSF